MKEEDYTSTTCTSSVSSEPSDEEPLDNFPEDVCEYKLNWVGGLICIALILAAGWTKWWLLIFLCFATGGYKYCTKHKHS